jgi:hypothetical protein
LFLSNENSNDVEVEVEREREREREREILEIFINGPIDMKLQR